MPMYNLTENNNNYWQTSRSLWQHYRNDPNNNITQSESCKSKTKIAGKKNLAASNTKDVKIGVLVKYLSNF